MINIGLEINPDVANYSDAFVRKLGIGSIFAESSTNKDIYRQIENLQFLSNENIPYHKHSYSKLLDISDEGNTYNEEPFFKNLHALKQAGTDLSQAEMFPQKISNKLHKTWTDRNGGVHASLGSFEEKESIFSLENINILRDERSASWCQIMLAPSQIFINKKWKQLNTMGNEYYLRSFFGEQDPNRILLANNPLAGGRWNHTRIPGVSLDF